MEKTKHIFKHLKTYGIILEWVKFPTIMLTGFKILKFVIGKELILG